MQDSTNVSEKSFEQSIFLMVPKPSPYYFLRFGGYGDGSYLIPDDIQDIDACFSPGVSDFKHFEDDLSQCGIKSYLCDFSTDVEKLKTPLINGMQFFEKKWLDIWGKEDSISLDEWVNKYSPDPSKDLILQMDIEGAEYRNLYATSKSTLNRFRIISLELHWIGDLKNDVSVILQKLDETHTCIHAHPNNCCGDFIENATGLNVPNIIELTYLRKDRFIGNPDHFHKPKLPHPLDVNVTPNPPLLLNDKWNLLNV